MIEKILKFELIHFILIIILVGKESMNAKKQKTDFVIQKLRIFQKQTSQFFCFFAFIDSFPTKIIIKIKWMSSDFNIF